MARCYFRRNKGVSIEQDRPRPREMHKRRGSDVDYASAGSLLGVPADSKKAGTREWCGESDSNGHMMWGWGW